MNLYRHELRSYRTSTIVWIIALSGYAVLFLTMLVSFLQDVAVSKGIIEQLPEAVRTAFNIRAETFLTLNGFYSLLLIDLTFIGAVQAMNLGVGIMSKEVSGKTVDFLLTKPITRRNVYVQKVLATLTIIVITNLVFQVVTLSSAVLFGHESFNIAVFVRLSGILFATQLYFLGIGLAVSMVIPKIRSVIAVSIPAVFIFFIVGLLDSLVGNQAARFLSPFKYYDTAYIIQHGSYEWQYIGLELVVVASAIAGGYWLLARKDIRAVA